VSSRGATFPAREAARVTFVASIVFVGVVAGSLALWKLRAVLALFLFGITLAAAMRPGVERLASWRVPRAIAVLIHYLAFLALLALFLSFIVPTLTHEVQAALDTAHTAHGTGGRGLKARALDALAQRLHHLPSTGRLIREGAFVGEQALKALAGILFTLAVAAYWIFDRDRAVDVVASLLPRPKRKRLRDTWLLIDQKLGAFVRGELVLIAFVSTLASLAFFVVGEPYWLLVGVGVGILEIVPVIGPLAALMVTVAVGLTASWHVAAFAAAALLAIRLVEDYLVTPRVLGGAVGLPPLLTLVSVAAIGILLGGFYVLLSIPIASLVMTVLDVTVRGVDPAEAEVPTVLLSARDNSP
jgi:predicted PurR-regulated permease PerM